MCVQENTACLKLNTRGFIKFFCSWSVEFFSWAFLVFLMKESKKRRQKQPGKLMAKSRSQPVNLSGARPLMNPLQYKHWSNALNLATIIFAINRQFLMTQVTSSPTKLTSLHEQWLFVYCLMPFSWPICNYRILLKNEISRTYVNDLHASFEDMVCLRFSTYFLRGHNMLCLPKPLTTFYGINSFSYLAAKSWNSLPDHYHTISDFTSFRLLISTRKILFCTF